MNDRSIGATQQTDANHFIGRYLVSICIVVFLAFSFARTPSIFISPRFWAEEGVLYFQQIQHLGWLNSLTFTANSNFQFLINILVTISTSVPLSLAPSVTTYGGIVLACALPYAIGRAAKDNGTDPILAIVASALVASVGMSFEIFGSATNIQWYGGAALFFAVFWRFENSRPSVGLITFALLYGWSGIPAAMLFPAFLVMAFARSSRAHFAIAAILIVGTAIQIGAMLSAPIVSRDFDRSFTILVLPTVFQSILGLWLTPTLTSAMGGASLSIVDKLSLVAVSAMILAFPIKEAANARILTLFTVVVGLCASMTQTLGAGGNAAELLKPVTGGRYYFISTCAIIAAFMFASKSSPRVMRIPLIAALGINVAVWYSNDWSGFTSGSSWRQEVDGCLESTCKLQIWPGWLYVTADNKM
ncbi:hypothetical protein [Rhizobium sp. RHZ01]|uniref:hypothetical protein n=1 Tax=Rhizobium sp. RHZ01 TaxID=2769304 RepID=UPI001784EE96|nr:hypothetical protein [Rhizobium sp. RHZ01]MBD9443986.1 hypothetical protein [Rhizobium sp. RHZ01]